MTAVPFAAALVEVFVAEVEVLVAALVVEVAAFVELVEVEAALVELVEVEALLVDVDEEDFAVVEVMTSAMSSQSSVSSEAATVGVAAAVEVVPVKRGGALAVEVARFRLPSCMEVVSSSAMPTGLTMVAAAHSTPSKVIVPVKAKVGASG